jgi:hypothetical protein
VRDEVGPLRTFAPSHIPTSAPSSNIRAQARPATAGKNPPVAGALHSSDRYSESSEVGHPSYSPNLPVDPVLWVSQKDVRNASWWQSQKPDLVILGLWTRPKYDPIRRDVPIPFKCSWFRLHVYYLLHDILLNSLVIIESGRSNACCGAIYITNRPWLRIIP